MSNQNENSISNSVAAMLSESDEHFREGNFTEALELLNTAKRLDTNNRTIHVSLYNIHQAMGMSDEAEVDLQNLIESSPHDVQTWRTVGSHYLKVKNWQRAEDALRKALEIEPTHGMTHSDLGFLYLKIGRFDEAHTSFENAIQFGTEHGSLFYGMGLVHLQQGEFEHARQYLGQALDVNVRMGVPNTEAVGTHCALAWLYLEQGQENLAKQHIRQALESHPELEEPHLLDAWFWQRKGNILKARSALDGARRTTKALTHFLPEEVVRAKYQTIEREVGQVLAPPSVEGEVLIARRARLWENIVAGGLFGLFGGLVWSALVHMQKMRGYAVVIAIIILVVLILKYRKNDIVAGPCESALLSFLQLTSFFRWGVLGFIVASVAYFLGLKMWFNIEDAKRFTARGMGHRVAKAKFIGIPPATFIVVNGFLAAGIVWLTAAIDFKLGFPPPFGYWVGVVVFLVFSMLRHVGEGVIDNALHRIFVKA